MKTKLEYQPKITETNKAICDKYWLREDDEQSGFVYTCKELEQILRLRHKEIFKIVKQNAYLVVLNCHCINCNVTKICHARSELVQLKTEIWRCDICWKALPKRETQEHLNYALKEEHLEQDKKQSIISYLNEYRALTILPSLEDISNIDSLLLAATIESLGSKNLKTTTPIRNKSSLPLSPFFVLDESILQHLFNSSLLLLNVEKSFNYVTCDEQKKLKIDYHQATFDFAYATDDLIKIVVGAKSKTNINTLVDNINFRNWCQNIQLMECFSYLVDRSKLNGLAPDIGEKLISLLISCLDNCSVSEVFYMIWDAVENAAAYSRKPKITRESASDSIYNNIQINYGKISNGSWKGKGCNRDISHPQSVVARVFFDYVFGIEDCGFNHTLNELFISYKP